MNRILAFFVVLFITFPLNMSAQSFRISNLPAWSYTYDKFSNEIYYTDSQGRLWIKNLNDSTERLGPFPSIPAFAHDEHQCVYLAGDSLMIHNFDNNTDYFVYSSPDPYYNYNYTFSPNDEYLLFYLHYFSFADSSVHEMNFSPDYEFEYDWIDETEVIYVDNENYMISYNFVTNITDTLFVSPLYVPILAFAYNEGNNLLYYGLGELHNPKIHTYNITTHSDSIVYNSENDPGNCMESTWFQSMRWSPNNTRMAFFCFGLEVTNTIYTFDSDSGRAYRYTDCGSEGYAYHLTWLNNDTIMFLSNNDNFIYGFTLDHPLLIKEESDHTIPAEFRVSAYPNPFNGTVNINIDGIIKEPEIRIYNIDGEEIKRFENISGSGYRYRELWDGRNNSGENVSSGVYLVIVRDQQNPLSVKGSSKIIYLK